jgi:molybdenum cofactor cytidylyltransferase
VDAVVLAAGRASRMGRPKHLIEVEGAPMLARVVRALARSRVRRTVVVLRPGDEAGHRLAAQLGVPAVEAESAREGRAASVRAGLRAVGEEADAVLFALVDQPFLEAGDFDALIERFARGGAGIVYPTYARDRGSPCLFARAYREELLRLRGSEGGRVVLGRHEEDSAPVALPPERGRDVDSPEDLAR